MFAIRNRILRFIYYSYKQNRKRSNFSKVRRRFQEPLIVRQAKLSLPLNDSIESKAIHRIKNIKYQSKEIRRNIERWSKETIESRGLERDKRENREKQ